MKTIIKIILVVAGSLLLSVKTFAAVTADTQAIIDAIVSLKTNVQANLASSTNTVDQQLSNLFDDTFVGTDTASPNLLTLFNQLATNFYNWYITSNFAGIFSLPSPIGPAQPLTSISSISHPSVEDLIKSSNMITATRGLLSQSIGYNIMRDPLGKLMDVKSLLSQPLISGTDSTSDANVIDPSYLGLNDPSKSFTPFGSLDSSAPTADNVPSILDLIGVDNYAVDTQSSAQKNTTSLQDKARMFISYILLSSPPPKNFIIPPKSAAKDGILMMSLPAPSVSTTGASTVAPTAINISTNTDTTKYDGQSIQNEYDRMVDALNRDSEYYQPYQTKVRVTNVLRSLYTESLLHAYQERVPDPIDGMSVVDREKALALAGLTQAYYNNLQNKSVADINLEMLQALNKLVYFVYKLHQDNERLSLIVSSIGMQPSFQSIQDDMNFVNPINAIITNKCWDVTLSTFAGNKEICQNPRSVKPAGINLGSQ